ncbi:MAP7 domain-containing protein 3 [Cricetulus griseus]|uniref:MAP7 domain-containing protein 3 n=1 Tax=Cricetulus griseus TaxID=10029 RepID=G3H6K8_CRIGR|nr:MAP7 domain-containing protein 3 [Cricetulus griseus]
MEKISVIPNENTNTGMTKYVFRYVTVPMFTSDELKSSAMFGKSSVKVPVPRKSEVTPTKKIGTPLQEYVERAIDIPAETPPQMSMETFSQETPSQANVDEPSHVETANLEMAFQNVEDISEDNVVTYPKMNIEVFNSTKHPESNAEEFPTVSMDASSSVGPSPVVSKDSSPALSTGSSSFASVEISPVVSMDASPEESIDTSPELSMDSASAVASEANIETYLQISGELNLEASVEAQPDKNVEASPEASPKVSVGAQSRQGECGKVSVGAQSRQEPRSGQKKRKSYHQETTTIPDTMLQMAIISCTWVAPTFSHEGCKGNNDMMKSQDSAEKRKKEQERIMLQNLQERLERKKGSEMVDKSEEDEADDEGETESDEGSLETLSSGMKTPFSKLKKFYKNSKRRPQKLVFLQAESGEVDTQKKIFFNGNMKAAKQNEPKESTTQVKASKIPTKKPPTRTVRSRKTKEANSTIQSSLSVATNQEWICDKIIDLSHTTESPVIKTAAGSNKQNLKDYVTTCQGPQAPLDHKNRGKPVSAPLTKVLSHLHIAGKATDLANPFASGCPRMAFGGQEEDSGESVGMI